MRPDRCADCLPSLTTEGLCPRCKDAHFEVMSQQIGDLVGAVNTLEQRLKLLEDLLYQVARRDEDKRRISP